MINAGESWPSERAKIFKIFPLFAKFIFVDMKSVKPAKPKNITRTFGTNAAKNPFLA